MKKKIIIPVLIVLLICIPATFLYYRWQQNQEYIKTDSGLIPRDTTELVLTPDNFPSDDILTQLTQLNRIDARQVSLSVAEYEALQQAVPGAVVLWNIPFQGTYYPEDTEELTIAALSPDDIAMLYHFPKLHMVDLGEVENTDIISDLQNLGPDLALRYRIVLNGTAYPQDTVRLELKDADLDDLAAALPYLPGLQEISFTGTAPDNDEIHSLMSAYPNISFLWDLEVMGILTSNAVTVLDFSGIIMENTEEVESKLKYFPNLERVEMCDCGISSEAMDALSQRHPNIKFVWNIKIRDGKLRTDAISFIPYKLGYDIGKPLLDGDCKELKYCRDLICMDLGHMKIRDISFLENMPNMQYLVLVDMPCRDFSVLGNLENLVYLELFNVQFTQHELLLNMTKLEDLNISSTPTTDIDVLRQMTWLKRLWITRNSDPEGCAFQHAGGFQCPSFH